jgi:NADH-quinone oxidoreductase subunit E
MTFSPELEARFEKFLAKYPADRKRSALIPMLMYGQDEVGSITDELINEVAKRVGVTPLQVNEVVGFYSMLHKGKGMGKYHVQVCTNISCLILGGDELYDRACHKLGLGHKEVSADGFVSLEEVECMGACSWAPAIQVNYDFYHDVTPEQLDKLLDGLKAGKKPEEIAGIEKVNPY